LSSGSAIRSSRLESLFGALIRESDAIATWETILTELEALLLAEEGVNLTSETTPNLTRLEFPLPDQQRLRSRMTVDGWLDLALTPIRDTPRFRYETKAGEYISFEAASAGQQATALLKVLLSQSGMPLIIDQPEDDLDSQVIQDVVTWMWDAKAKRQVIFASHNANLVVNGDAELVVICDYRRAGDQSGGKIKLHSPRDGGRRKGVQIAEKQVRILKTTPGLNLIAKMAWSPGMGRGAGLRQSRVSAGQQ